MECETNKPWRSFRIVTFVTRVPWQIAVEYTQTEKVIRNAFERIPPTLSSTDTHFPDVALTSLLKITLRHHHLACEQHGERRKRCSRSRSRHTSRQLEKNSSIFIAQVRCFDALDVRVGGER